MQVVLDAKTMPRIPGAKIAILQSKWYSEQLDSMSKKCIEMLVAAECPTPEFYILPGSWELPLAAKTIMRSASEDKPYDAIIVFGAIMKGETYHFEMIADACSRDFGAVMLSEGVPIINEVIPITKMEQLIARSADDGFNKGIEAALAAAEIIAWRRELAKRTA